MNDDHIRQTLRSFILATFLHGEDPATLKDSTLLVSSGVVTSLSLLELVNFIETTFGVNLESEDLGVERMDSIDRMVELVAERAGMDTDGVRTGT